MKKGKWRYGLRKFLEEKLFPNLTFIDVALTASICLGIPAPLNRLRESLKTLKTLGIISEATTIRNTYNETVKRIHDEDKTGKKP